MAFDRTNPTHLATAKTYITVTKAIDPNVASTDDILAQFNDPANNPIIETGANPMLAVDLIDAVWTSAVSSQDQFKVQLLIEATNSMSDDLSDFRVRAMALSAGLSTAIGLNVRSLNWAESEYGVVDSNGVYESVTLTRDDWFAARDFVA